jgi:monothiol glutaredoxin
MSFDPKADQPYEEFEDGVADLIEEHGVILFMKGTSLLPQCGYSRTALALVQQYRDDVETVNVLDAVDRFREALGAQSDWETIPQVYVDGEFVGGADILEELEERGELADTLNSDETNNDDDADAAPF